MRIPEGSWLVTEIAVGGELVPPLEGARLTLEITGDSIGGSAGVNRFVGQVSEEGFGPLATTRRAGSPDLMDQERLFFLTSMRSIRLNRTAKRWFCWCPGLLSCLWLR